jgi:four helix bundle protein
MTSYSKPDNNFSSLEDLEIYQRALELSHLAWKIYGSLDKVYKFQIGNQFLGAADSVGANIAEGYGRYHYKDSIRFYYLARGSLFEVKHWTKLLYERNFISELMNETIQKEINTIALKTNSYIRYLKAQSAKTP